MPSAVHCGHGRDHRRRPATVSIDQVRPHLVSLRVHGLSKLTIAGRAGVPAELVDLILWRQITRVCAFAAAALLAVVVTPAFRPGREPVVATARRLRMLCAMGWGLAELGRRCGIPRQTLAGWRNKRYRSVPIAGSEAVTVVFDDLYAADGPSDLARATATRRGWDRQVWLDEDLADPDALPLDSATLVDPIAVERVLTGERGLVDTLSRHEVAEVVLRGTCSGASQRDLSDLLGLSVRQVCRMRAALRNQGLLPALPKDATPTAEDNDARTGSRPGCRVARPGRSAAVLAGRSWPGGRKPHRGGTGRPADPRAGGAGPGRGHGPGVRRAGRVGARLVGTGACALRRAAPDNVTADSARVG